MFDFRSFYNFFPEFFCLNTFSVTSKYFRFEFSMQSFNKEVHIKVSISPIIFFLWGTLKLPNFMIDEINTVIR